jgi:hypothetical protein
MERSTGAPPPRMKVPPPAGPAFSVVLTMFTTWRTAGAPPAPGPPVGMMGKTLCVGLPDRESAPGGVCGGSGGVGEAVLKEADPVGAGRVGFGDFGAEGGGEFGFGAIA